MHLVYYSHLFKMGGRTCKKKRQVLNKLVYTLYTKIPHNGNRVRFWCGFSWKTLTHLWVRGSRNLTTWLITSCTRSWETHLFFFFSFSLMKIFFFLLIGISIVCEVEFKTQFMSHFYNVFFLSFVSAFRI